MMLPTESDNMRFGVDVRRLVAAGLTLALSALLKQPCATGDWQDGRQYRRLCYTDVVPLYGTEHLNGSPGGRPNELLDMAAELGAEATYVLPDAKRKPYDDRNALMMDLVREVLGPVAQALPTRGYRVIHRKSDPRWKIKGPGLGHGVDGLRRQLEVLQD